MTPTQKAIKLLNGRIEFLNRQIERAIVDVGTMNWKRGERKALRLAVAALERTDTIGLTMTAKMNVTSGGPLGSFYHTTQPTMRCELIGVSTPEVVTLDWAYFGPTTELGLLDSGILRRQIGLKLRSADPCNLIYVMREVEPESRIFVQAKINPGKHTSDDCGADGYVGLAEASVPPLQLGKLQAVFRKLATGEVLDVKENGQVVLTVPLDGAASKLKGHYGVRSDSGRFVFKLSPA